MSEIILFFLLIGVVVSFLFIITSDRPSQTMEYSSALGPNDPGQDGNNKIFNVLELVQFQDVGATKLPNVPRKNGQAASSDRVITAPPEKSSPPSLIAETKQKSSASPAPQTEKVSPSSPTPTKNQPSFPEPTAELKTSATATDSDLIQLDDLPQDGTIDYHPEQQGEDAKIFPVKNGLKNPIIPSKTSVLPQVDFDNEPISTKALKAFQRGKEQDLSNPGAKVDGPIPLAPLSALDHEDQPDSANSETPPIAVEPLDLEELESMAEFDQIDCIMTYLHQTGHKDEQNYQDTLGQLRQLYQGQYQKLKQLEIQKENPSWEISQVSKELEHERQQLGAVQQQLDFVQAERQSLSKENSTLKLRLNQSEQTQIDLENDLLRTKQRLNLIAIIVAVVVSTGVGISLVLSSSSSDTRATQDGDEPTTTLDN